MKKILSGVLGFTTFCASAYAHEAHKAVTQKIEIPWGLQGAGELLNIHPLFTHFPVALLLFSAAFYFSGTLLRKHHFFPVGKWLLYSGVLTVIPAVWTGLRAAEGVPHNEEIHQIMIRHQYLGLALLALSAILSLWLFFSRSDMPSRGRIVFLAGLGVMSAMVLQQADFGGRMVFLNGVGIGKKNIRQAETEVNPAVEKWKEIESRQSRLKEIIETGSLESVHQIAFAIRDLVRALPAENLNADQKTVFADLIEDVEEESTLLDKYGDGGDQIKTRETFERFNRTLLSIRNLYGKN